LAGSIFALQNGIEQHLPHALLDNPRVQEFGALISPFVSQQLQAHRSLVRALEQQQALVGTMAVQLQALHQQLPFLADVEQAVAEPLPAQNPEPIDELSIPPEPPTKRPVYSKKKVNFGNTLGGSTKVTVRNSLLKAMKENGISARLFEQAGYHANQSQIAEATVVFTMHNPSETPRKLAYERAETLVRALRGPRNQRKQNLAGHNQAKLIDAVARLLLDHKKYTQVANESFLRVSLVVAYLATLHSSFQFLA
jgi:glutamine synthetase adenylyltransferase